MKLCSDCHTRQAVLKRGQDTVCAECYAERPVLPLAKWDEVMTPAYILALERNIKAMEQAIAEFERRLAAIEWPMRRITELEKRINDMEADS